MLTRIKRSWALEFLLCLLIAGNALADVQPQNRDEFIEDQMRFVKGLDPEKQLNEDPEWDDPDLTVKAQRVYRTRALHHLPADLKAEEIAYLRTLPQTWRLEAVQFDVPGALEAWADAHLLALKANLCDMRHALEITPEERAAYEAAVDAYLEGFEKEVFLATFSMIPPRYVQDAAQRFRQELLRLLHLPGLRSLEIPDSATIAGLRKDLVDHLQAKCEETLQAMGLIEGQLKNDQIASIVSHTTGDYALSKWLEDPLHTFYQAAGWDPQMASPCEQFHTQAQAADDLYYALVGPLIDAWMEELVRRTDPRYIVTIE